MSDVFKIELAEGASHQEAATLVSALSEVDGVEETSADTRSLTAALLLVKVVGGALADVASALPILEKVVGMIRGKGVTGAKIELPDGTRIEVDSASVDDIQRLLSAATAKG